MVAEGQPRMPFSKRAALWALGVSVAVFGAGAVLVRQSVRVDAAVRRMTAEHAARRSAYALESQLGRSLSAAYALGAAVRQRGVLEDFEALATQMITVYGGIENLQLAPGGVVRQIHPLPGNEAAIGHDLLADEARRAEATAAIATRQLTLAGPFDLRQGGTGLIGRYPVFRAGARGEEFWGFANVLLRLDAVLEASGLLDLRKEGYAFELDRREAGSGRSLPVARAGALTVEPQRVRIRVPNGEWTLAVAPVAGWGDTTRETVRWAIAALVAALAGVVAWMVGRQPARLRALVAERTAELRRAYERLEQDAEERRRAEERIREVHKMEAIGLLAGGVAHDFNNLLTGILACSSEIAEDAPPGSTTREAARTIEQAGKRAAELTRQLLGFARRGKLRVAPVDLHAVVGEVVRFLERTLGQRIAVISRLEASRASVLGDAGQLQQAILNLAVNARDAMPAGGTLTLATSLVEVGERDLAAHPTARAGCYVALAVVDTGVGIPREILDRIFEPFFTTKEAGGGTGMGLATVYGIATSHGGFVEVESEVGRGARFTLHLPAHDGAPCSEVAPAARPIEPRRVLVVDDEALVRTATQHALERMGCVTVGADGGAAAVTFLRENPRAVDLAIVDLAMPGMDGVDTFRALREVEAGLPVVIASGYGHNGRVQEVLDAGAVDFLQKPWSSEELAAAVRRAPPRAPRA